MDYEKGNEIKILDYFRANPPTIPQMFYNTVKNAGNCPANTYKIGKEWITITYNEWAVISEEIALSLIAHGVKKGDDIGVMSILSAQRTWADMSILLTGAVSTTISPLVSDDEIIYIINRSDVKFIFVENLMMIHRINSLWNQLPSLKGLICLDESYMGDFNSTWSLDEFRSSSREAHSALSGVLTDRWQRLSGDDSARLNYTIGTTGQLNCSQIKHGEWVAGEGKGNRRILAENLNGKLNNVYTSIMPIASINERTFGFFSMVAIGAEIKYGSGPSGINNLRDIKKQRQKHEMQAQVV